MSLRDCLGTLEHIMKCKKYSSMIFWSAVERMYKDMCDEVGVIPMALKEPDWVNSNRSFTLFWGDGKRQVVEGPNISAAMNDAGYGQGALGALDFWMPGNDNSYLWIPEERVWKKI
jgi:hypothetical protein